VGLGQYVVPARCEESFREQVRALADRLPPISLREQHDDVGRLVDQTVILAKTDHPHLPSKPKPVIWVRSGLVSGDVESAYAALLWLKQLVRPPPYPCPYADALTKSYRFVWLPSLARWELREGWLPSGRQPPSPAPMPCDPGEIALLVDVVSRRIPCGRVVIPRKDGPYAHYAHWLPRLTSAFALVDRFGPAREVSGHPNNAANGGIRPVRWDARVVADAGSLADEAHQRVTEAGGHVVRIEIPGSAGDFAAWSIQRTDVAATLLEHVIGLRYGLIAVNRGSGPIQLEGFDPLEVGEALIVPRGDPRLGFESQSRDCAASPFASTAAPA
jgi:hypothetical protein